MRIGSLLATHFSTSSRTNGVLASVASHEEKTCARCPPWDYMLRLSLDQLAPATAEKLQAMAKRYERLAEDLRSLAMVAQ